MHRLLIALSFCAACTATVRTAPPPAEPAGPPPAAPPPAPPPPAPVATQPAPPPPASPPPAAAPGHHAAYLAAIQDLREARAFLQRTPGMAGDIKWDEKSAIREIDASIKEIHEAKLDVGAAPEEPHVDMKMGYGDRLDKARIKLADAANNLAEREDSQAARREIQEAANHLNAARRLIDDAIKDKRADAAPPPPAPPANAHPAYAMALGNLRHARALLERPAGAVDVKWDEKMAITEIDAAIKEARDARMDDGVPMTEHPPIDNKMVYRDRIREALKLLGDSAKDLEEKEDNAWAKKDRKQAVEHVRRAEKSVREAMSDRKADAEEKREEKAEKKAAKGH